MNVVYIDGKFYKEEDAKISVFDHAVLYGDGVFDTFRIYNGSAFRMKDHIDRLYKSAKGISLKIPLSKKELVNTINETYRRSQLKDAFVRVLITRGKGDMGVDPRTCLIPTVIIMVVEREIKDSEGIKVIVSSKRRMPSASLDPSIKSLNYLNNVLAKIEAIQNGVDDAIMLNMDGFVAEATTENVFIVKNGKVYTPPLTSGILEGITRTAIMDLWSVEEKVLTLSKLYEADEIFLSGTGIEIQPVIELDGRQVGVGRKGQVTTKIEEKFRNTVCQNS